MESTVEAIATNHLIFIFATIGITGIVLGRLSEILKIPGYNIISSIYDNTCNFNSTS